MVQLDSSEISKRDLHSAVFGQEEIEMRLGAKDEMVHYLHSNLTGNTQAHFSVTYLSTVHSNLVELHSKHTSIHGSTVYCITSSLVPV